MPVKNAVTFLSIIENLWRSGEILSKIQWLLPILVSSFKQMIHVTSGMINMNYGEFILGVECLIYEYIRRQIVLQWLS